MRRQPLGYSRRMEQFRILTLPEEHYQHLRSLIVHTCAAGVHTSQLRPLAETHELVEQAVAFKPGIDLGRVEITSFGPRGLVLEPMPQETRAQKPAEEA
jgi:hypothetical protein